VAASAIQQLRTGAKRNPTRQTLKALADFFGVPAGYFVDSAAAERTKAEMDLLAPCATGTSAGWPCAPTGCVSTA
jgi:transcriptional regulator with XRE-family HTH domain